MVKVKNGIIANFLIINEKIKKKNDVEHLFILNSIYCFVHILFFIEFLIFDITPMYLFNIFSILFFLVLQGVMYFKSNVSYEMIDYLQSLEIILHQIVAVLVVGLEPGFQYILFGLATPLITFDNKRYKNNNYTKYALSILSFCVLKILYEYNILDPIYQMDTTYARFHSVAVIAIVFLVLNKTILYSYKQYEIKAKQHLEEQKLEIEKRVKMQDNIIYSIADLIENRDESTGEHVYRTSNFTWAIAEELSHNPKYKDILDDKYIKNIVSAASLHDIGKIKTPDAILKKPGRLTDEEFDIIKSHTVDGGNIISNIFEDIENEDFIDIASQIAKHHHERYDGKGYPCGLSGEQIPLSARIVAICDVYDALVSERCYKKKFDVDTAIDIIKNEKGKQFDPDIVDAFLAVKKRQRKNIKE